MEEDYERDYEGEIEINISILPKEKNIFIGEPTSSGCSYDYENTEDLVKKIEFYISNYVEDRLKKWHNEENEETEEL